MGTCGESSQQYTTREPIIAYFKSTKAHKVALSVREGLTAWTRWAEKKSKGWNDEVHSNSKSLKKGSVADDLAF